MKKLFCCISSLCIMFSTICQSSFAVNTTTLNLSSSNTTGALQLYLEEQSTYDIDSIDKNTQCRLNSLGLFNYEILQIKPEFLENIMNSDLKDVNASTEYIQYSESSAGNISAKALNKSEVDEVISSLANTSSDCSTVEINSSAKTSTSVLKKTMLATSVKVNGKKKTSCTYVCSWLKSPSQRMIDIASIGWGINQGSFDSTSSFYANYSCIDTITYYKKKSNSNDYKKYTETESYEYNITSSMRKDASENGLYCKSKLKADENDSAGSTTYYHSYNNHTFTMGFYLTNVSNISHTYFRGVYSHQKKKSSFKIDSISVNFGITGVPSISISGGYKKETYYSDIGDVLLLNHVY